MASGVTRRGFIGASACAGLGIAMAPRARAADGAGGGKAKVVIAHDTKALANGVPVQSVVDAMVAKVIAGVAGKSNPDEAWKAIVPGSTERVAIKWNGLFTNASTRPEVVIAVVKGLVHAGVGEDRILLFDFCRGDYKNLGWSQVPGFPKVRCLGAQEDGGFGPEVKAGAVTTRLAKLLTDSTDVLINIPRLKHHILTGCTFALKNHLGSIPKQGAKDLHGHTENIADLNALGPIKSKTRLVVADTLIGIYDKGPTYQPGFTWEASSIMGGTDPVAIDAVGVGILKKHRESLGRAYKELKPPVTYLDRAREIGLGVADLDSIEVSQV